MSGTIGLVKEVIPKPSKRIETLAEVLDKKVSMQELWKSESGQILLKALQDDSATQLNALLSFETLSLDEIRGYLCKYRSNLTLLSTLKNTSNIEEVEAMLQLAVKQEAPRNHR